jgi:hypothetical protein
MIERVPTSSSCRLGRIAHGPQNLNGCYGGAYDEKTKNPPVSEFLAYNGSLLQVATVPGPEGRGLLGALATGAGQNAPALPSQPPDLLGGAASRALEHWMRIPCVEQSKYRQELAASPDKVFERLNNEAPAGLRPPTKSTREWTRWYEGPTPIN